MDTNIPPKSKFVLILIVFIPLLIVFSFIIFDTKTPREYYLEDRININIQSKIVFIYNDRKNHDIQFLQFKDTSIGIPASWEDKFQIFDSIHKRKGSLKLSQFRNGKLIEVFDYNEVRKRK